MGRFAIVALFLSGCSLYEGHGNDPSGSSADAAVDPLLERWERQVEPILANKCGACHMAQPGDTTDPLLMFLGGGSSREDMETFLNSSAVAQAPESIEQSPIFVVQGHEGPMLDAADRSVILSFLEYWRTGN
jgi:hypothetical protein